MLALCLAIVGCGGSSGSGSDSDSGFDSSARDSFVGTWQLYEADYEDDEYDDDILPFYSYKQPKAVSESCYRDLSGYDVIDEDGELHEGEGYCLDAYGRIYKYLPDGRAILEDGCRLLDGRAQMSLLSDLEGDDGLPF